MKIRDITGLDRIYKFINKKTKGTRKLSNIVAAFQQRRDSRQVSLGFTYRFNKGKVNGQKRKTGGADAEKSRVNTGGEN